MTPDAIWYALGGRGETPPRLGRYHGELIILGGSRCVWEDYEKVRKRGGDIMAVNDIGSHFKGYIRHWVTLHPAYFPGWRTYRDGHHYGSGQPYLTHSQKEHKGVDVVWRVANLGGTSGLFATQVGLMMGYDRITLCGIPMNTEAHYFDPPGEERRDFTDKTAHGVWREFSKQYFAGRVKSVSGWTRELLGKPSWID